MADSLQEQLFRKGLVSERKFKEHEARTTLATGEPGGVLVADLSELDRCQTVGEFKEAARKVLGVNSGLAQAVLDRANHKFAGRGQDKRKARWFFYAVRDGLRGKSAGEQQRFLKRAFRRSGATFEPPKDFA